MTESFCDCQAANQDSDNRDLVKSRRFLRCSMTALHSMMSAARSLLCFAGGSEAMTVCLEKTKQDSRPFNHMRILLHYYNVLLDNVTDLRLFLGGIAHLCHGDFR